MNLSVLAWVAATKLAILAGINPVGLVVVALFWPQPEPVDAPVPVAQVAENAK